MPESPVPPSVMKLNSRPLPPLDIGLVACFLQGNSSPPAPGSQEPDLAIAQRAVAAAKRAGKPPENGRGRGPETGRVGRAQRAPPSIIRPLSGGARCARPTVRVTSRQKPMSKSAGKNTASGGAFCAIAHHGALTPGSGGALHSARIQASARMVHGGQGVGCGRSRNGSFPEATMAALLDFPSGAIAQREPGRPGRRRSSPRKSGTRRRDHLLRISTRDARLARSGADLLSEAHCPGGCQAIGRRRATRQRN